MQSHVRIATGVSLGVASASVILRLLARRLRGQCLFADDWLIIVALTFEWCIGIAGLILLQKGLGKHIVDVAPGKLITYMKVLYSGATLYALCIVAIKLSLLALYRRLFPVKRMIYACRIVGATVIAWGVIVSVLGFLICIPVRKVWYPTIPGRCFNLAHFYYGTQIPNLVTDVIIWALPIKMVYDLPLEARQKTILGIIFGMGAMVVIFDVVRLIVLIDLARKGSDPTWNQVSSAIWTCVEPAAAITVACLSHLKPIVDWLAEYYKTSLPYESRGVPCTGSTNYSRTLVTQSQTVVQQPDRMLGSDSTKSTKAVDAAGVHPPPYLLAAALMAVNHSVSEYSTIRASYSSQESISESDSGHSNHTTISQNAEHSSSQSMNTSLAYPATVAVSSRRQSHTFTAVDSLHAVAFESIQIKDNTKETPRRSSQYSTDDVLLPPASNQIASRMTVMSTDPATATEIGARRGKPAKVEESEVVTSPSQGQTLGLYGKSPERKSVASRQWFC